MAAQNDEYDIQALPMASGMRSSGSRFAGKWTPVLARLAKIASKLYLLVRVVFLIFSETNYWCWVIFYVECAFAHEYNQAQSIVIATEKFGDANLGQHRERLRLTSSKDQNKDLPLVDILIACCGEELDVILDTARGACQVDYPINRFRVLILDDGESSELQHKILEMQRTWSNLQYHCRGKAASKGKVFSKAGNLNYALFDIQEAMKQPPEFIAVLDADFIPSPEYLRATLPHLLRHPKLAIAGACQDFYNLPVNDPLAQSLDNWQRRLVPHLNQLGSCFHAHSGAVIRRSTLMQHQGFPTVALNEDVLLSNILLGTGSQIISLPEMLQMGRCPESLQGHISQRTRWGIGLTQMILGLRSTSNNTIPKELRWGIAKQGMMILLSILNRALLLFVIPFALVSCQTLIPAPSTLSLKIQGTLSLISITLTWLFEWSLTLKSGFGGPPFGDLEEIWLAPRYLVVIFKYCFCKPSSSGSSVTGSTLNSWNGKDSQGFFTCLKRDIWDVGVIVNLLSFSMTLWAMGHATISSYQRDAHMLSSPAWPPILQLCYLIVSSNWIPIACTFSPPAWINPMTLAMRPGSMDSHTMFTRPGLQAPLRPSRRPLGYANHQAFVPMILVGLFLSFVWL